MSAIGRNARDQPIVTFSVAQQFRRLSFHVHATLNTKIAGRTRERLSLVADTVGCVRATVSQKHHVPTIQTVRPIIGAKAVRHQKLLRHLFPPRVGLPISGGECVGSWAE
jgi:hypothetical protein